MEEQKRRKEEEMKKKKEEEWREEQRIMKERQKIEQEFKKEEEMKKAKQVEFQKANAEILNQKNQNKNKQSMNDPPHSNYVVDRKGAKPDLFGD